MTAARFDFERCEREERLMVRFSVLMVAVSTACLAASCGSALAAESDVTKERARASRGHA